jgi:hypothetical protein
MKAWIKAVLAAPVVANPQPSDKGQWQQGCVDAIHDYGMKP